MAQQYSRDESYACVHCKKPLWPASARKCSKCGSVFCSTECMRESQAHIVTCKRISALFEKYGSRIPEWHIGNPLDGDDTGDGYGPSFVALGVLTIASVIATVYAGYKIVNRKLLSDSVSSASGEPTDPAGDSDESPLDGFGISNPDTKNPNLIRLFDTPGTALAMSAILSKESEGVDFSVFYDAWVQQLVATIPAVVLHPVFAITKISGTVKFKLRGSATDFERARALASAASLFDLSGATIVLSGSSGNEMDAMCLDLVTRIVRITSGNYDRKDGPGPSTYVFKKLSIPNGVLAKDDPPSDEPSRDRAPSVVFDRCSGYASILSHFGTINVLTLIQSLFGGVATTEFENVRRAAIDHSALKLNIEIRAGFGTATKSGSGLSSAALRFLEDMARDATGLMRINTIKAISLTSGSDASVSEVAKRPEEEKIKLEKVTLVDCDMVLAEMVLKFARPTSLYVTRPRTPGYRINWGLSGNLERFSLTSTDITDDAARKAISALGKKAGSVKKLTLPNIPTDSDWKVLRGMKEHLEAILYQRGSVPPFNIKRSMPRTTVKALSQDALR